MSATEKEQLLRRQDRLASLELGEQARLRQFNQDLEKDPDAPRLRQIMRRYYDWLKTLPQYQRMELNQLSPEKRIQRIKKLLQDQKNKPPKRPEPLRVEGIKRLLQEQARKLGKQLEPQDIEGLFAWIAKMADRYGARFLEGLPEARRKELQQQIESVREPQRRRMVFGWLWMQWQTANPGRPSPVSDKDLAELRAKLSKATRERLESKPAAEQWRIISDWVTLLPQGGSMWYRPDELISEQSEQELALFFEHVLNEEEKDRLLSLPGDQMFRELWREYARARFSRTIPRSAEQAGAGKQPGAWQAQRAKAGKAGQQVPSSSSAAPKSPDRPQRSRPAKGGEAVAEPE